MFPGLELWHMKETSEDYLFQSATHNAPIAFTKNNYHKHIPRHPFIAGKEGLSKIEDALLDPHVITGYTQNNLADRAKRKCQAFYRIVKRENIGGGKSLLDYWQVIIVRNERHKRWEVATVLYEEDALEYAMINTRIEAVLHDYR